MIRAVFFDFYGTLANWGPSAEGIQQAAAAADGIALNQPAITLAYITANSYFDTENALQPIRQRSKEEVAAFFAEYERCLLTAAGAVDVSLDTADRIWQRVSATPKTMALYPDAKDALAELNAEGLRLGVVSNIGPELDDWLDRLGVADLLPVRATIANTGANKPWPRIFEKALEWAGVSAGEAVPRRRQRRVRCPWSAGRRHRAGAGSSRRRSAEHSGGARRALAVRGRHRRSRHSRRRIADVAQTSLHV